MTIQIQYEPTTYKLGWDWTFECQHDSTHIESVDYGFPDASIGDYVDDWRDEQVCDDCGEIVDEN